MLRPFSSHRTLGMLLCAAVLVLASIFLLRHLSTEPLQDYDEATYTEVVHEALANHAYLSLTYNQLPFLEKPPLPFWAMALSESMLGENEFAQRLPFVIMGVLLIAAVMLVALEVSSDWWAAALGGAVLASTSPFVMTAREVRMDAPIALFIVLALYCALRALKNSRWWIGFGVALALAVLTKSVIALFAGIAALALVVYFRKFFAVVKDKNLYWGVAAFLLLAVPWHLYEWAKFGNAFWASYIGKQVLLRTQENLFWTVSLTNADYVHFIQLFVWPWLGVFFAALAGVLIFWKWVPVPSRAVVQACTVTMLSMLVVFFVSKTKAPTYLVPLYPFGAIVIALAFASIKNNYAYFAAALVGVVCVVLGWQFSYYNAYYQNPYFSNVVDMARDEHAIGKIVKPLPMNDPVYVYDDQNLGSIMYYGRHPLWELTATSTPAAGSFIVVTTSGLKTFAQAFPQFSTGVAYQGPQVVLLEVLSED